MLGEVSRCVDSPECTHAALAAATNQQSAQQTDLGIHAIATCSYDDNEENINLSQVQEKPMHSGNKESTDVWSCYMCVTAYPHTQKG